MRRTILLADDSPTIQRLVTSTFADGDFDVISVSNGDAAIRKFEEIHPNVVLADIYMPGKNGYEVCAYVRRHSTLGGTPVILLVGAFDAFDDDKANDAGATSNITKPFEPHALVSLVESVSTDGLHPPVHAPAPVHVSAPMTSAEPAPAAERVSVEVAATPDAAVQPADPDDVLGLDALFPAGGEGQNAVSEQEIERIAERVIQRISARVIESIAWEIVPDITEKIVREEFKRINES